MIDASLGRASCCGFPGGMQPCPPFPQPVPPQPVPPVPLPQTEPDSLQLRLAAAQTALANGAVIPFSAAVRQIGNGLRFDPGTGAVSVLEAGVYVIEWQMLVQTEADENTAPVIALQSLDGQSVLGYSGIPAASAADGALISGSAVAALPAGTAWVLVNASGAPLNIPAVGAAPAVFAASMTITEVPVSGQFS